MVTRVGTITLDVPRNGTFSTELFARYQRSELALILTLMEMVVNGVSTRKVRRVRRISAVRASARAQSPTSAGNSTGSSWTGTSAASTRRASPS